MTQRVEAGSLRAGWSQQSSVGRLFRPFRTDLGEIDAVTLREDAPLVEEGKDGGSVGVLHDLAGLALDGPVHNREREVLGVQDLAEELDHPSGGLLVAPGAKPARSP